MLFCTTGIFIVIILKVKIIKEDDIPIQLIEKFI
jgi:hypothetical protein